MSILIDPELSAESLRNALYGGRLVLLTRLRAVSEFVEYTQKQLIELFYPHDPEHAHEHFDKTEMANMLVRWKHGFIHANESKDLVREIICEAGFEAEFTHYDVPKPRTSFPIGHLTSGIAYAFPWHRDVWYSAPAQQINWWLPIFPAREDNAMSFDLQSFDRGISNNSDTFDYYKNNADRRLNHHGIALTQEWQQRPAAVDYEPLHELVVLPAVGQVLLFSGAQLHRSIPNISGQSRFSVDFRTADARDLLAGQGAPIVDVHCAGTAIRDFHNVEDGGSFDEQTITHIFGAPPPDALLVFSLAEEEQSV